MEPGSFTRNLVLVTAPIAHTAVQNHPSSGRIASSAHPNSSSERVFSTSDRKIVLRRPLCAKAKVHRYKTFRTKLRTLFVPTKPARLAFRNRTPPLSSIKRAKGGSAADSEVKRLVGIRILVCQTISDDIRPNSCPINISHRRRRASLPAFGPFSVLNLARTQVRILV